MSQRIPLVSVVLIALAACSTAETPATQTPTKTKAQRDSAFGQSGLRGASGIMKAMNAADSAKARAAAIDSASKP